MKTSKGHILEISGFIIFKKIFNIDLIIFSLAFFTMISLVYVQNYINQYIYCNLDNYNIIFVIYCLIRETFFVNYFYLIYYHYVVFSFLEKSSYKLLIIFTLDFLMILALKIYNIDPFHDFVDLYGTIIVIGFCSLVYYFWRSKFSLREIKIKIFIKLFLIFFTLLIHQFFMKNYIIPIVRELTLDVGQGKILFQFFLIFYFKIYGYILFKGMVYMIKHSLPNKNEDCIRIVSKFYLLDVISSCLPSIISEPLGSKEFWLGLFNFIYHVLVLYDRENNLWRIFKRFLRKLLKKELKVKKIKEAETKVRQVISSCINEMIFVVYLQVVIMFYFRRVFVSVVSFISKNCQLEMLDYIDIGGWNILILLGFVVLWILSLLILM